MNELPDEDIVVVSGCIDPKGLDAKLARIREKSEEFERYLAACVQTQSCAKCGAIAELDVDASFRDYAATYTCRNCERIKDEAAFAAACERAGIPSDVRGATIENFQTDRPDINPQFQSPAQFADAARGFLVKDKRNLILAGTPGIGKGHLAAAVVMHFIRKKWRAAWVECARLFRDYHRAYEARENEAITNRLGAIGMLVLDEICLRDLPADGEEILFTILDRRHKEKRPTILLGNKPAAEIKAWLGGRITDRLRSGGVSFCYGEWESMRGHSADGAF